ncbi:MAG: ribosome maturation factor RimM [Angustibacter sp.]
MQRIVARLGRPHGLRGELTVDVRTDAPERRLVVGARLGTDPPQAGPVVVRSVRWHRGVLLAAFDGVADRAAAELLRGVQLVVDAEDSDEPDAWYPDQLIGLAVRDTGGRPLGAVADLETGIAQDLLVVRADSGDVVRVPFVTALVPVVDVPAGVVVVDPPGGLFDTPSPGSEQSPGQERPVIEAPTTGLGG